MSVTARRQGTVISRHKSEFGVLLKAAKRGDADTMALAIHAGANPRAVDDLTGGSVLQLGWPSIASFR